LETPNRYQYVNSNPINLVDPSGLTFTERDVLLGHHEYSYNCGWIDWTHVGQGEPAYDLLSKIRYAGENLGSDHWGFRIRGYSGGTIPVGPLRVRLIATLFDDRAIVPDKEIKKRYLSNSEDQLTSLAVSIFMDAEMLFEGNQAKFGNRSNFSEEDLPSNLIGFWVGKERFFHRKPFLELKENVRTACRAFGVEDSLNVYRNTYNGNAHNEIINDWTSWYPRFIKLTSCSTFEREENRNCQTVNRLFPIQFEALSNMRIRPHVGETWWWGSATIIGAYIPTDQEDVFKVY
jgi:hypothetical protein